MNRQIRIIGLIALVLFGVTFVNLNWVQLVNAQHLADNPANVRVILKEYAIARGPILSGDEKTIAASVKTPTETLKYLRTYPAGATYAHVSGYYSYVYGRAQLEATYNKDLTGQGGGLTMQSLSDQLLGGTQQGNTVVTTINDQLQKAAAQALGTHKGAVVALDPTTGVILAMVASPSYDPSTISSHDPNADTAAWKALQANPDKPMLNRATSQTYPPGSTFKVISTAAALQNGLGVDTSYAPAGQFLPAQTNQPIKNFGGEVCGGNMTQSFTQSCNVYFARLATQLPAGALAKTARDFGFGEAPPLDIPDVADGPRGGRHRQPGQDHGAPPREGGAGPPGQCPPVDPTRAVEDGRLPGRGGDAHDADGGRRRLGHRHRRPDPRREGCGQDRHGAERDGPASPRLVHCVRPRGCAEDRGGRPGGERRQPRQRGDRWQGVGAHRPAGHGGRPAGARMVRR